METATDDRESLEGSSSDGDSEEENVGAIGSRGRIGVRENVSPLEDEGPSSLEPEEEGSDNEMASMLASASNQVSRFLQDSDSDEGEESREELR